MLKLRISNDALKYLMSFAYILMFKDRVIVDGVKRNTGDKSHYKI